MIENIGKADRRAKIANDAATSQITIEFEQVSVDLAHYVKAAFEEARKSIKHAVANISGR